jgi:hypothetical protein
MAAKYKKKTTKRYSSKASAEAEAKRQRAKGNTASVRYDRKTNTWIVDIIILAFALSLFGALLRRS